MNLNGVTKTCLYAALRRGRKHQHACVVSLQSPCVGLQFWLWSL